MVSDGDSKAYAKVFEMNVYSEDVQITKLDCWPCAKTDGKAASKSEISNKGEISRW